jgi:predicted solute-binding protein
MKLTIVFDSIVFFPFFEKKILLICIRCIDMSNCSRISKSNTEYNTCSVLFLISRKETMSVMVCTEEKKNKKRQYVCISIVYLMS